MALEPDTKDNPCAGTTSVPATQQEDDERLDWDPSLARAPQASPPPMQDDYMRIALGADPAAASSPDAPQPGTPLPANTPLVYPFIPPPTLEMEPLEEHHEQPAPAAATEPTEDTATESTQPSTPTSATMTTGSLATTPRTSPDGPTADSATESWWPDHGHWMSRDGDGDGGGAERKAERDEARCSLSYVRRVQSDGAAGPYHLLDGQVWRGGSADKKRAWRRHQWVVGG